MTESLQTYNAIIPSMSNVYIRANVTLGVTSIRSLPDYDVKGPFLALPPGQFRTILFFNLVTSLRNGTISDLFCENLQVNHYELINKSSHLVLNSPHHPNSKIPTWPNILTWPKRYQLPQQRKQPSRPYLSDKFHPGSKDLFCDEVQWQKVLDKSVEYLQDLLLIQD